MLLDAFTSYGTQLLWPLTTPPIARSSIFIIDPLYSVPLLVAVLAGALFGLHGRTARWPLRAGADHLLPGFHLAGKQMAEQRVQASITRQGIEVERMFSTPTPFNSLLWRVILVDGEHYYETLVSWWDDAPPALVRLPRNAHGRCAGRVTSA